jgi:hypothetical protein
MKKHMYYIQYNDEPNTQLEPCTESNFEQSKYEKDATFYRTEKNELYCFDKDSDEWIIC